MRRAGAAWGLLAALVVAACQRPEGPARPSTGAPAPAVAAREALARGDCVTAMPLLQAALAAAPHDLRLHYELAVCASRLDAREQAIAEFRWVVEHAPAGAEERRIAEAWLREVAAPDEPASAPERPVPGGAQVTGRALWAEDGQPPRPRARLLLHLVGLPGTPTAGRHEVVRTDERGEFRFTGVPAGPYMLTNRVAGPPTWRVRVEVEAGRETRVELTPANSTRVRDDFPES